MKRITTNDTESLITEEATSTNARVSVDNSAATVEQAATTSAPSSDNGDNFSNIFLSFFKKRAAKSPLGDSSKAEKKVSLLDNSDDSNKAEYDFNIPISTRSLKAKCSNFIKRLSNISPTKASDVEPDDPAESEESPLIVQKRDLRYCVQHDSPSFDLNRLFPKPLYNYDGACIVPIEQCPPIKNIFKNLTKSIGGNRFVVFRNSEEVGILKDCDDNLCPLEFSYTGEINTLMSKINTLYSKIKIYADSRLTPCLENGITQTIYVRIYPLSRPTAQPEDKKTVCGIVLHMVMLDALKLDSDGIHNSVQLEKSRLIDAEILKLITLNNASSTTFRNTSEILYSTDGGLTFRPMHKSIGIQSILHRGKPGLLIKIRGHNKQIYKQAINNLLYSGRREILSYASPKDLLEDANKKIANSILTPEQYYAEHQDIDFNKDINIYIYPSMKVSLEPSDDDINKDDIEYDHYEDKGLLALEKTSKDTYNVIIAIMSLLISVTVIFLVIALINMFYTKNHTIDVYHMMNYILGALIISVCSTVICCMTDHKNQN